MSVVAGGRLPLTRTRAGVLPPLSLRRTGTKVAVVVVVRAQMMTLRCARVLWGGHSGEPRQSAITAGSARQDSHNPGTCR